MSKESSMTKATKKNGHPAIEGSSKDFRKETPILGRTHFCH
jgi:hypothetical protein